MDFDNLFFLYYVFEYGKAIYDHSRPFEPKIRAVKTNLGLFFGLRGPKNWYLPYLEIHMLDNEKLFSFFYVLRVWGSHFKFNYKHFEDVSGDHIP